MQYSFNAQITRLRAFRLGVVLTAIATASICIAYYSARMSAQNSGTAARPHSRVNTIGRHAQFRAAASAPRRNVLIFVVDGMRPGSINAIDTPTLFQLAHNGVTFNNSHSIFPTFTMPNGSAIATGHYLGDTGAFSNTLGPGYSLTLPAPNFTNSVPAIPFSETPTPFIESDPILGELDVHNGGNFLSEESLLAFARQQGYATAAIGKVGPSLVQDVTQGNPVAGAVPVPTTIVVDDSTGRAGGIPLSAEVIARANAMGLAVVAPTRNNTTTNQQNNGFSGDNMNPGTLAANVVQQQYFADMATKVAIPEFIANNTPFVMVFWSRDPDGTQHNQGDSLNSLVPGINGPTSRLAAQNADHDLSQIINTLAATGLIANTDIFVTADHGFGTISRYSLDANNTPTASFSATQTYLRTDGSLEVNANYLPPGFVAIDLAHGLNLPLYDPNALLTDTSGNPTGYKPIVTTPPPGVAPTSTVGRRPSGANGLIGGTGKLSPTDASVIIAANGGSDLIYVPGSNPTTIKNVVNVLLQQDYVSGLFVDDAVGPIPGTLPLSAINLHGSTGMPSPSVIVNFRTFSTDITNPLYTGVEVADTTLQHGQGMHGTFGRQDTFNTMLAMGPDFKAGYVDPYPISNADVAPTLAFILGFPIPAKGTLTGRVASEALTVSGAPAQSVVVGGVLYSDPDPRGTRTFVAYQQVGAVRYFDAAGFFGKTIGLPVLGGTVANDTLTAGTSYLALEGLAGNDVLIGGSNRVTMIGDSGADIFVLAPANGVATIADFTKTDNDKIGLANGITFASLTLRANSGNTQITYGRSRLLAIVVGKNPTDFSPTDFVSYP